MGVYIKGMEMPTRCAVCWLMDGEDSWCCACRGKHLASEFRYGIKDRPDWCPLIEIPSHGRLIDEEALAQDAYRRMLECEKYKRPDQKPYEVLRAIELAPTVIPAEEDTADKELKWAVGAVKCQKCGYEWVAVRPVEASELECPKCGAFEGRVKTHEKKVDDG